MSNNHKGMHQAELDFYQTQIGPLLKTAKGHYQKLVLLVGGNWQKRTAILQAVADHLGLKYYALGLSLSKALLDRVPKDRPLVVAEYVTALVSAKPENGICLDHIEILFDPSLYTDPLRLLQTHSRSHILLASWPGKYEKKRLTYAEPGHPEYFSQVADDILTYSIEVSE